MSALARPAVLAWLLALAVLALHPTLLAERWLPGRELMLVAVPLLALVGLVARALAARGGARAGAWLVAVGAALVLAGLGLDGLLGRHGTVTLGLGQQSGTFDEAGPGGRSLGLRPLGFRFGAGARTDEGVSLLLPLGPVELTSRRAIAVGGFRLADPRWTATGEAARLHVAASDGRRVELTPDGPVQLGDLTLALEQYFPDFALDENQRPLTRSLEPRNPAALLSVARGDELHRVFVLRSMPDVHRVEPLGLSFSLLDVEPEGRITIGVHRQPYALAVVLGGLLLIAGLALGTRSLPENRGEPRAAGPLVAGAGLLAFLWLVDSGGVLAWRLGVAGPAGRLQLRGVGVLLGLALIAALAGVLLLAAQRLAGGVDVGGVARRALAVAVLAAGAGVALGLVRVVSGGLGLAPALPVLGVACAALVLAAALWPPFGSREPLVVPIVAGLLVAVTLGVGVWSTTTHGSYATPLTAASAAAAVLGLVACEATGFSALRRLALLVAVLALFALPY